MVALGAKTRIIIDKKKPLTELLLCIKEWHLLFYLFSQLRCLKVFTSIKEIREYEKNAVLEKETAKNDLKKAGIASAASVGGLLLFGIIMKGYGVGETQFMSQKVGDLPIALWTFLALAVAELGGSSYAAVKGYQGAKHLLKPDYPVQGKREAHIRVKRENK